MESVTLAIAMNPQAIMLRAVEHFRAGRHADAEESARQVLLQQPDHAEAMHLLGVLALHHAQPALAETLIQQSLAILPDVAEAWRNLGLASGQQGNWPQAAAAFQHAAALGGPGEFESLDGWGYALIETHQAKQAITVLQRALKLRPQAAPTWTRLALALIRDGKLDEAQLPINEALRLGGDDVHAHYAMGIVFSLRGEVHQAIDALEQARQLAPDNAKVLSSLGTELEKLDRVEESLACHRHALDLMRALQPRAPEVEAGVYVNYANALKDRGQPQTVVDCYRKALALNPASAEAQTGLLMTLHRSPDVSPVEIRDAHVAWGRAHADPLTAVALPHHNAREPGRRLRIGYLSGDFCQHPIAHFIEPVLRHHDRSAFEVFCFSAHPKHDEVTARLHGYADQWRELFGIDDDALAGYVRGDGIDLLIDLSGHTAHHRLPLLARKPAPLQLTWLGYQNTLGMKAIDYRITDGICDPPGQTEHLHTETLLRLPQAFFCYQPPACGGADEAVGPPPAAAAGRVTFASLNNFGKVHEGLLRLWGQLLQRVPNSRLLMFIPDGDAGGQALRERFESLGLDFSRLLFWPRKKLPEYLAMHRQVDIALDPFPCNGHTTMMHALWMGVPTVTLRGATYVSRMGASVMMHAGLPELIADTPEEYLQIASAWAADVDRLKRVRTTLRERLRASALLDGERFTRHLETLYRNAWTRWCEQG